MDRNNFLLGVRGGLPAAQDRVTGMAYHVAPLAALSSILETGIHAQEEAGRVWKACNWREGDASVYAWLHPRAAIEHAKRQAKRLGSPQVVVAFNIPEPKASILQGGWKPDITLWGTGAICLQGAVPASDMVDTLEVKPG